MGKKFNPLKLYEELVSKGVTPDRLSDFVEGLKQRVENPQWLFTPCPIVYLEQHKGFFVLPFLDLRIAKDKVWGIMVGQTFYSIGAMPRGSIYDVEKTLANYRDEKMSSCSQEQKQRISVPTSKELSRIALVHKRSPFLRTANLLQKQGFCVDVVRGGRCFNYWVLPETTKKKFQLMSFREDLTKGHVYKRFTMTYWARFIYVVCYDEKFDCIGATDEYGILDENGRTALEVLLK